MAVFVGSELQADVAYLIDDGELSNCFYCGDSLPDEYVFWVGTGQVLKLHPRCALTLACNLIGDSKALEAGARGEKGHAA